MDEKPVKLPQSVLLGREAERRRMQSKDLKSSPCPICGGLGWVPIHPNVEADIDALECPVCEDGRVYS